MSVLAEFNKNYAGLYSRSASGDSGSGEDGGGFNQTYGWVYSAEQLSKVENVSLSDVFELKTVYCMNMLGYLKSKSEYEQEQIKKFRDGKY